jgi:hypothetical protein
LAEADTAATIYLLSREDWTASACSGILQRQHNTLATKITGCHKVKPKKYLAKGVQRANVLALRFDDFLDGLVAQAQIQAGAVVLEVLGQVHETLPHDKVAGNALAANHDTSVVPKQAR